jgi:DNA-binding transcriptional LysR family regulator
VRRLEEELGVRLVNRTRRSVSLTGAGSAMLEEARRVGCVADSLQPTVPRALTKT